MSASSSSSSSLVFFTLQKANFPVYYVRIAYIDDDKYI
jgi:hypothetical protein